MSRLYLALVCLAVCWALLSASDSVSKRETAGNLAVDFPYNGSGGLYPPIGITKMTVDTVGLTVPSNLFLGLFATSDVHDITVRILPGEGYRVITQPSGKIAPMKLGDSASLTGVFQPITKGTWKVTVEAYAIWGDTTPVKPVKDERTFYIHLSDTLNRVMTATEYILLNQEPRPAERITGKEGFIIKKRPQGRMAHPTVRDSLMKKGSGKNRSRGTFNLQGSLERRRQNVDDLWHCQKYEAQVAM